MSRAELFEAIGHIMRNKVAHEFRLLTVTATAKWWRWLAVLGVWGGLSLLFPVTLSMAAITVTYRDHSQELDYFSRYPLELLQLALDHSPRTYQLRPGLIEQAQKRVLILLEEGDIDVMWTMTTREREALLQPIRIPIYRGLIGWRLPMIKADRAGLFAAIERPEQLQALVAGQRYDWPDTSILRANGYRVSGTSSYEGLFKMLELERIDYFPRGLSEVWSEAAVYADRGLIVEPNLLLHYPAAAYFFVRKDATQLAGDIRTGLEAIIANNQFDQLFQRYYGNDIEKAGLATRRVFRLHNPLLPEATPLKREELWYRLPSGAVNAVDPPSESVPDRKP